MANMMKLSERARRLYPLVLASAALSGCDQGVLDPAGAVGGAERVILLDSLVIMLAIVLPTILCTLVFGWWFRATNTRAGYAPHWAHSGRLELIVWSIPVLVVLFLGGIAWYGSHDLDPAKPLISERKPLEVEAVALDWKWLFIYPDQQIASVNQLMIPVGTPVHFRLTSASVMNVFFVPQLGSEIYAMNGMITELNLQADRRGTFLGLAAHFNGDGFSDMTFDARSASPEEFFRWVTVARNRGASQLPHRPCACGGPHHHLFLGCSDASHLRTRHGPCARNFMHSADGHPPCLLSPHHHGTRQHQQCASAWLRRLGRVFRRARVDLDHGAP
jgi:cytochrome o ubiquinol oxidase subunit 2